MRVYPFTYHKTSLLTYSILKINHNLLIYNKHKEKSFVALVTGLPYKCSITPMSRCKIKIK